MKDVVQNLLLYIPFGYFFVKGRTDRSRLLLLTVVVCSGALSIATEAAQIFQPRRYPSATDVVNNFVGALMGVILAGRGGKKEHQIGCRSD
jgi:VanZ family protein